LSKRVTDEWTDWEDLETEFDTEVSYWAEDNSVPATYRNDATDRTVLKAERHNRRLRKQQAAERRFLDT
jgi:hypothetical protein